MPFINKLLTLFGINPKSFEEQLKDEIMALKDLQLKSLQPFVTFDDISPIMILKHTGKIKDIISNASKSGLLPKDDRTIHYVLNNISEQEKMIELSGKGYIYDTSIYSSQVGASISEILKDLLLLR